MTNNLRAGLAFPLPTHQRGGVTLARDETDVEQAIRIILGTAPGERPMRPEFGCGVHDVVFDRIDAATVGRIETEVRAALDRWEPRIEVTGVRFELASADRGEVVIEIEYRLRATNHV